MCGVLTHKYTVLFRPAEGFTTWYTEDEWETLDIYDDIPAEVGWFCDKCIEIV